ncbi:MAG: bifunctional hydroxymethylpyrimidine kinase/phosphomethylpyrimidine kinase [Porticoccaceae bacterium]|mgnify:CR=1 FL=1|nr:bifunctional hydroxymethylpyrimidine kinase/phosphomethylpyrimidine kinase [Porticoccaceae bacterium]|tara:strand:+ start:53 stop:820 length:768 start_codon:yes stop_codon:yes gene_type:complete
MNQILTIGGSDSSGGAGVLADKETLDSLGAHTFCVITAITAQSKERFHHSLVIPKKTLEAQLESIDLPKIGAIKIGMLPDSHTIEVVRRFLLKAGPVKSVLDPVFTSSSGGNLITEEGISSIRSRLLPLASIITPNINEAECLTKIVASCKQGIVKQAEECIELGASAALVKGGHLQIDSCPDALSQKNEKVFLFDRKRIPGGTEVRGTGCRLASAISYFLASGNSVTKAVENASQYLESFLKSKIISPQKFLGH